MPQQAIPPKPHKPVKLPKPNLPVQQTQKLSVQQQTQPVQIPIQQKPQTNSVQRIPQAQNAVDPQEFMNFEDDDEDNVDSSEDILDILATPIKRFYLIQRLEKLNDKLNQLRIKNDVLGVVITFIDSFSYDALLSISNKLVEELYTQVNKNAQKEEI